MMKLQPATCMNCGCMMVLTGDREICLRAPTSEEAIIFNSSASAIKEAIAEMAIFGRRT